MKAMHKINVGDLWLLKEKYLLKNLFVKGELELVLNTVR